MLIVILNYDINIYSVNKQYTDVKDTKLIRSHLYCILKEYQSKRFFATRNIIYDAINFRTKIAHKEPNICVKLG